MNRFMKLNGFDLNKLSVFCVVVEEKGYRGASEKVGLTRSAISQSMTALESQLGKKLFHRSGIRLIPTKDALRFRFDIRRYQAGLESALDRFQERAASESGRLRVGAYQEFAKRKLLPAIGRFLDSNPRAQIQFYFDSPSRLESLLENDRIDLAISIYPHRKRGIESMKIYEEELCLVGRKDRVAENAGLAEISRLPVIDYYPTHLLFKRWWTVHSRKTPPLVQVRAFAGTADMVLEMVERGIGVGIVPKYLLKGTSSRLRIVAPTSRKLIDHLWLNRKSGHAERKLDQEFVSEVVRISG
jgi:DNA-binding transcriptional LysR family regulator